MSLVSLVWRFTLPDHEVEEFVAALRAETVAVNRRPGQNVVAFNATLLDEGSAEQAKAAATTFLATHHEHLRTLKALGGSSELDFGVFVGSSNSFAPSITFDERILKDAA